MSQRRNFTAFVSGPTFSGKTFLLNRIAEKFPRRLVLDFLGEHEGEFPGAIEAWSFIETLRALKKAAQSPRWTVVASVEESDVPALVNALAPSVRGDTVGFSRAVGGMVLQMSEIDTVLPNNGGNPEMRSIFKRGRHNELSVLCGTQRPSETSRIVTSQSHMICTFRQHEPLDLTYLSSVMGGSRVRPLIASLPQHWHLRYWRTTGALERVDPDGKAELVTFPE